MNISKFESFLSLVASTRYHQSQFWNNGRTQQELKTSLELESRLDTYLSRC